MAVNEKVPMSLIIAALEAAEKMADAIEAAEDSRYSMTPAAEAAWAFRKAMRGEG